MKSYASYFALIGFLLALSGCASSPKAGFRYSELCHTEAGFHLYTLGLPTDRGIVSFGRTPDVDLDGRPFANGNYRTQVVTLPLSYGFDYIDIPSAKGPPRRDFEVSAPDGPAGIYRVSFALQGSPDCEPPVANEPADAPPGKCLVRKWLGPLSMVANERLFLIHDAPATPKETALGIYKSRTRILDRQRGALAEFILISVKGFYGDTDHGSCDGPTREPYPESALFKQVWPGRF